MWRRALGMVLLQNSGLSNQPGLGQAHLPPATSGPLLTISWPQLPRLRNRESIILTLWKQEGPGWDTVLGKRSESLA